MRIHLLIDAYFWSTRPALAVWLWEAPLRADWKIWTGVKLSRESDLTKLQKCGKEEAWTRRSQEDSNES